MFSGLLPKDLFKRKGRLAKSYFKQNYCHVCHIRFAVFFPLPSCCVSSLLSSSSIVKLSEGWISFSFDKTSEADEISRIFLRVSST